MGDWYDNGEELLVGATQEATPPSSTRSKPSTKHAIPTFGIQQDTSFKADSMGRNSLPFPKRVTSQTNRPQKGTPITPGLSLSSYNHNQHDKKNTLHQSSTVNSFPRKQNVFEKLKPTGSISSAAESHGQQSNINSAQNKTRCSTQSSNSLIESAVVVPKLKHEFQSQYTVDNGKSKEIRFNNKTYGRNTRSSRDEMKSPHANEVIDLVDEESEEACVNSAISQPDLTQRDSMDEKIFQQYGSIPGVTVHEKRLLFGKTEDRIPLDRIYLGVYGFCSDPCASIRRLYVRVDSGVNKCLLISLNEPSAGQLKEEDVRLEEIPFNLIKKVVYGIIDKTKYGHEAVVFLAVQAKLSLRSIAVGHNCMLSPTSTNNSAQSGKHIMLLMTKQYSEKFCEQLRRVPIFQKTNMISTLHTVHNMEEWMLPHSQTRGLDPNALQKEWSDRAKKEKDAEKRSERRERRKEKLERVKVDPNDSLPYTVYPIEPEVVDAITIFNGDMKCLEPGEYLNDNLVDLKIKHLIRTRLSEEQQTRIHAFSCMFYSRLTSQNTINGCKLVSRWTKNVDIFDKDILLVPINYTYHWSLVVVVQPRALLAKLEDLVSGDLSHLLHRSSSRQSANSSTVKKPKESACDASDVEAGAKSENVHMDVCDVPAAFSPAHKPSVVGSPKEQTESDNHLTSSDCLTQSREHNACILHCDSLGMHGTTTIGNKLKFYLQFEWEARKKKTFEETIQAKHFPIEEDGVVKARSNSLEATWENTQKHLDNYRAQIFNGIPIIKCKVPSQQNGFDCGLFVTKFAEVILLNPLTSTDDDIKDKFRKQIQGTFNFDQSDIDNERKELKGLLQRIKEERDQLTRTLKLESVHSPQDAAAQVLAVEEAANGFASSPATFVVKTNDSGGCSSPHSSPMSRGSSTPTNISISRKYDANIEDTRTENTKNTSDFDVFIADGGDEIPSETAAAREVATTTNGDDPHSCSRACQKHQQQEIAFQEAAKDTKKTELQGEVVPSSREIFECLQTGSLDTSERIKRKCDGDDFCRSKKSKEYNGENGRVVHPIIAKPTVIPKASQSVQENRLEIEKKVYIAPKRNIDNFMSLYPNSILPSEISSSMNSVFAPQVGLQSPVMLSAVSTPTVPVMRGTEEEDIGEVVSVESLLRSEQLRRGQTCSNSQRSGTSDIKEAGKVRYGIAACKAGIGQEQSKG